MLQSETCLSISSWISSGCDSDCTSSFSLQMQRLMKDHMRYDYMYKSRDATFVSNFFPHLQLEYVPENSLCKIYIFLPSWFLFQPCCIEKSQNHSLYVAWNLKNVKKKKKSLKAASKMCAFMFLYLVVRTYYWLQKVLLVIAPFLYTWIKPNVHFFYRCIYSPANESWYSLSYTCWVVCQSSVTHIHQRPVDCGDVTQVSSCLLSDGARKINGDQNYKENTRKTIFLALKYKKNI